ncbi:hypothetical protein RHMOL_Rhmol08G0136600 [Rhododendron molle]|uniref:Uncharacterized protein n=1 Tax=Rhododendron molle TaxID=49168 RepID=A0ACC0MN22_RHOML|nr:hypothetical protein RHMOL_Rhmol08G0136600 [Rhododendron molle]
MPLIPALGPFDFFYRIFGRLGSVVGWPETARRGRQYDFPPRLWGTHINSSKISRGLLIFRNKPSYSTKKKYLIVFWNTA